MCLAVFAEILKMFLAEFAEILKMFGFAYLKDKSNSNSAANT